MLPVDTTTAILQLMQEYNNRDNYLKFIGYRLFEIPCSFILGVLIGMLAVPVISVLLLLIIPDFKLTDDITGRIMFLIGAGILLHSWYRAFTNNRIETFGMEKRDNN
jgi:hypothetical protein